MEVSVCICIVTVVFWTIYFVVGTFVIVFLTVFLFFFALPFFFFFFFSFVVVSFYLQKKAFVWYFQFICWFSTAAWLWCEPASAAPRDCRHCCQTDSRVWHAGVQRTRVRHSNTLRCSSEVYRKLFLKNLESMVIFRIWFFVWFLLLSHHLC